MTTGGYQTPDGSGNGAPPRRNSVSTTYPLWRTCRANIEANYPWLVNERVFDGVEAFMIVLDVEEDARRLSGDTWIMRTPDDYFPVLTLYFTYADGWIVPRAAYADEP